MGRYLIIESEIKFHQLIKEALLHLDPNAQFETFDRVPHFQKKLNDLNDSDKKVFLKFDLYIIDLSLIAINEWKKSFDAFCAVAAPRSSICLTGYEHSMLTHKFLHQFDIYNFIFKPFDPLILKEVFHLALNVKKETQPLEIKSSLNVSAFVGILKDIELQCVSEVGFITLSEAPIPPGSVSKYLCPLFKNGKKESLWGQCISSTAHASKTGFYINKFQYYTIETTTLNQIRRFVQNHKQDVALNALWYFNTASSSMLKMAIVGIDNQQNHHYKTDFEMHYKNLSVEFIQPTNDLVYDHDLVLNISETPYDLLKKFFNSETPFFSISNNKLLDPQLKEYANQYKDIFIAPIDRSYMYKKMKLHVNRLQPKEEYAVVSVNCHEKMKVANTIQVTEVNELLLSFDYPRELNYKEYRNFVFLNQDEDQIVEIPAFCHFAGKGLASKKAAVYRHQFAFFGMTDRYLKEIRLWLLHNHILHQQN